MSSPFNPSNCLYTILGLKNGINHLTSVPLHSCFQKLLLEKISQHNCNFYFFFKKSCADFLFLKKQTYYLTDALTLISLTNILKETLKHKPEHLQGVWKNVAQAVIYDITPLHHTWIPTGQND